jgi:hypothetical protein
MEAQIALSLFDDALEGRIVRLKKRLNVDDIIEVRRVVSSGSSGSGSSGPQNLSGSCTSSRFAGLFCYLQRPPQEPGAGELEWAVRYRMFEMYQDWWTCWLTQDIAQQCEDEAFRFMARERWERVEMHSEDPKEIALTEIDVPDTQPSVTHWEEDLANYRFQRMLEKRAEREQALQIAIRAGAWATNEQEGGHETDAQRQARMARWLEESHRIGHVKRCHEANYIAAVRLALGKYLPLALPRQESTGSGELEL